MNDSSTTAGRVGRLQRLVRLTAMLCDGRRLNAGLIQDLFKISRRTLMRDLKVIRDAGMNVIYFPDFDDYRLVTKDF